MAAELWREEQGRQWMTSIKQTATGERLKWEWIHIVGPSCFLSPEHIQHEVSTVPDSV